MKPRVTLIQIAQEAKVHVSTVTRALKKNPRISLAVRQRIAKIAQKLGYVPDPMLSALCAYRRTKIPATFQSKLAWIVDSPTWNQYSCYQLYYEGASEQAKKLGYDLEVFAVGKGSLSSSRISQVLVNRGIRGLLICPLSRNRGHLSLNWDQFSVIAFGYSMVRPKVHLVTAAHYSAITTIMRQLRSLGYRRIGFALNNEINERMDHLWSAAFLSHLNLLPESQSLPILSTNHLSDETIVHWYETYRPEAIISNHQSLPKLMGARGYRIPEEVCIADPALQEVPDLEPFRCGVIEASRTIGQSAVDLLTGLLQRGERGIPEHPARLLIEGHWHQGVTSLRHPLSGNASKMNSPGNNAKLPIMDGSLCSSP